MKNKTHVIAEAGTNHNGKLDIALKLIDTAVAASADSVKFQIIHPEELYLPMVYNNGNYIDNEIFYQRKKWMLPDEAYRELAAYCKDKHISFAASVFDKKGVKLVDDMDVEYIKIASCDLNNYRFLKTAAETGRTIIISTGMATLGEIEQAVLACTSTGNNDLVLMHCVSLYPCPLSEMNLRFIDALKACFNFPVGFSDHSQSNLATAIAVSKGVEYVEKHFTLDRSSEGFDHSYSLEPKELVKYVRDIRECESACRHKLNKIGEQENNVKNRARRGLYAACDIEAGKLISCTDVLISRPEGDLKPQDVDLISGKRACRKIHRFEAISIDLIK
jgi:sialic acid synthase SpsE